MSLEIEKLIPQKVLAKKLGVNEDTLIRWATTGYHGEVIDRVTIGSRVFYEPEAIERFAKKTGKITAT